MIPGVSYGQLHWEDVEEGDDVTRVDDPITYRRVIMNAATTWDYFPGHHDPEYARAQGQPTIFVNTMHVLGFVDRVVTDWAGPRAFVVRRKVALQRSIYAGETMVGEGRVVAKRTDEVDGRIRHLVDLELTVKNQDGVVCFPATVTVELPPRSAEHADPSP